MRTISISAFIAVMAFLCSCTVYQNVPIDVLRTEEVTLPDKPLKIAFLYRNFKFQEDTMEHYYTKNGQLLFDKMNAKLNIDSIAVMSCLNGVANLLTQQNDSLDVVYYPYDIMPRERGLRISLLPVQQVKKLAFPAKADYLISLETLTYFFSQYKDYNGSYEQSCAMAAAWGIYEGETGQVVYRRTMTDTVYWNNQSKEPGSVAYPPRVPSIQLATSGFGEAFANRFSPEWVTVNRTLIIPPVQEFKDAFDYTEKQDWVNAAKIWIEYTPERFGRLAASACYNMALASEIHDNFESAVDWITKAVKYGSNYRNSEELRLSLEYQKILLQRTAVVERSEKRKTVLD